MKLFLLLWSMLKQNMVWRKFDSLDWASTEIWRYGKMLGRRCFLYREYGYSKPLWQFFTWPRSTTFLQTILFFKITILEKFKQTKSNHKNCFSPQLNNVLWCFESVKSEKLSSSSNRWATFFPQIFAHPNGSPGPNVSTYMLLNRMVGPSYL